MNGRGDRTLSEALVNSRAIFSPARILKMLRYVR